MHWRVRTQAGGGGDATPAVLGSDITARDLAELTDTQVESRGLASQVERRLIDELRHEMHLAVQNSVIDTFVRHLANFVWRYASVPVLLEHVLSGLFVHPCETGDSLEAASTAAVLLELLGELSDAQLVALHPSTLRVLRRAILPWPGTQAAASARRLDTALGAGRA